jgi:hypothetical protein
MHKKTSWLLLFASIFLFYCKGKVTYDLSEPGIVARTKAFHISTPVFRSLFAVMQRARLPEGKNTQTAVFKIIADKYFADEYRSNHTEQIDPNIQAEIHSVYYQTLGYYINDLNPEAMLNKYVKRVEVPSATTQKSLFDDKADAAYANVPLKRSEATKVVLATYGNDGSKKLTFDQLFDSLPHAGKLHLFTSPNPESLREMIMHNLRQQFLNDLVQNAPPAKQAEYAELKAIVENSILSRNLRYDMGMENANPHADNNAVKERAKSISFSRIKEYYAAHKDNYKEVQTVDCRHIRLKDYDMAQELRDKIEQGADMIALVKKYSIADDKNAAEPGLIRGIRNDTTLHERPRLHALCMMPKQGEADVVRDGVVYEVVKAEKRVDGYPPLDDTTHLKEDLAREIAGQDLKAEFEKKKEKILRRIDIRINKAELESIK